MKDKSENGVHFDMPKDDNNFWKISNTFKLKFVSYRNDAQLGFMQFFSLLVSNIVLFIALRVGTQKIQIVVKFS